MYKVSSTCCCNSLSSFPRFEDYHLLESVNYIVSICPRSITYECRNSKNCIARLRTASFILSLHRISYSNLYQSKSKAILYLRII